MIYHIENSDITKVTEGIVVHGCNAQGVMGSGVAKQLRATYPAIYDTYRNSLDKFIYSNTQHKALGSVSFHPVMISTNLVIANAITQEFYGRDGIKYVSYDAIEKAFELVARKAEMLDLNIHVPYLIGAGLGGGNIAVIETIIDQTVGDVDVYYHHWK